MNNYCTARLFYQLYKRVIREVKAGIKKKNAKGFSLSILCCHFNAYHNH